MKNSPDNRSVEVSMADLLTTKVLRIEIDKDIPLRLKATKEQGAIKITFIEV